jgi:hypothetical protein
LHQIHFYLHTALTCVCVCVYELLCKGSFHIKNNNFHC